MIHPRIFILQVKIHEQGFRPPVISRSPNEEGKLRTFHQKVEFGLKTGIKVRHSQGLCHYLHYCYQ
jgi:hypothetical protein